MAEKEGIKEIVTKYYPTGIFGFDRDGRPVCYEPLGRVDFFGLLHSAHPEEILQYKRQQYQRLTDICAEQEKVLGKNLGHASTMILDAEGANRKHLWRPGIDFYKQIIALYEKEFPNVRERIIIVNTVAIFPIIFNILKPFLSQSTRDKIKVLGKNWREEILEFIDKDNLPEFYGGVCKDSEGDPMCKGFISYGGTVPKENYVSENVKREDFQQTTVKAGTKFTKEIEITPEETNSKIKYQFLTDNYDIKFSVHFIPEDDGAVTQCVVPEKRHDAQIIMEEGEFIAEKCGTYIFVFDNTYSWLRGKELYYSINCSRD